MPFIHTLQIPSSCRLCVWYTVSGICVCVYVTNDIWVTITWTKVHCYTEKNADFDVRRSWFTVWILLNKSSNFARLLFLHLQIDDKGTYFGRD